MNARLCVRESINVDFILFRARSDALCVHGALIKAEYLYATVFRMLYRQRGKRRKIEAKGGKRGKSVRNCARDKQDHDKNSASLICFKSSLFAIHKRNYAYIKKKEQREKEDRSCWYQSAVYLEQTLLVATSNATSSVKAEKRKKKKKEREKTTKAR